MFLCFNSIHICALIVGDNAGNDGYPPMPPSTNVDPAFLASNSVDVNIEDDEEPYSIARAVDSDDDRPVAPLREQEMELIRRLCLNRDPLVHEFSDLSHSQHAYAEGRDDELLEAPKAGDSVEIQKGMVLEDLPTLRRWLHEYSVRRKRPFKVMHSYVERRYMVVCEMADCNWMVCARKQKATGKFKITKIVGPHTCAQTDLKQKHRQLTSTLIARKLYTTLKGQPNLKVRTIMEMTKEIFNYDIKYRKSTEGKATGLKDDIWGIGGEVRAVACNGQCNESTKSRHTLRVYPKAE
jgi:hypothetical protein